MGQKVHPNALRLGVNKNWQSAWFAKKGDYADNVIEDFEIRDFLRVRLRSAGLKDIIVKRYSNKVEVVMYVARPGVVIGKSGAEIESVKKALSRKYNMNVELKVFEVKSPDSSAQLIADNIQNQLERRIVPKFAAQRCIDNAKKVDIVKGIRIWVSGRIKGAEIARTEKFQWGTVPLQTMRADIDYAYLEALVPNAGKHGIKVWVYKGEKQNYSSIQ
jgi:small subunit ribosomal protein S3